MTKKKRDPRIDNGYITIGGVSVPARDVVRAKNLAKNAAKTKEAVRLNSASTPDEFDFRFQTDAKTPAKKTTKAKAAAKKVQAETRKETALAAGGYIARYNADIARYNADNKAKAKEAAKGPGKIDSRWAKVASKFDIMDGVKPEESVKTEATKALADGETLSVKYGTAVETAAKAFSTLSFEEVAKALADVTNRYVVVGTLDRNGQLSIAKPVAEKVYGSGCDPDKKAFPSLAAAAAGGYMQVPASTPVPTPTTATAPTQALASPYHASMPALGPITFRNSFSKHTTKGHQITVAPVDSGIQVMFNKMEGNVLIQTHFRISQEAAQILHDLLEMVSCVPVKGPIAVEMHVGSPSFKRSVVDA